MISDGAAALVVASPKVAEKLGRKPLGRIVASATSGTEPKDLFIAPVSAIRKALDRAGLEMHDPNAVWSLLAQPYSCGLTGLDVDDRQLTLGQHGGMPCRGERGRQRAAQLREQHFESLRARGADGTLEIVRFEGVAFGLRQAVEQPCGDSFEGWAGHERPS